MNNLINFQAGLEEAGPWRQIRGLLQSKVICEVVHAGDRQLIHVRVELKGDELEWVEMSEDDVHCLVR